MKFDELKNIVLLLSSGILIAGVATNLDEITDYKKQRSTCKRLEDLCDITIEIHEKALNRMGETKEETKE